MQGCSVRVAIVRDGRASARDLLRMTSVFVERLFSLRWREQDREPPRFAVAAEGGSRDLDSFLARARVAGRDGARPAEATRILREAQPDEAVACHGSRIDPWRVDARERWERARPVAAVEGAAPGEPLGAGAIAERTIRAQLGRAHL